MHELAICQSLLNQVEDIALQHQAETVSSITLGIGPLSGVESQLLINAYSIASAGTVAEQAKLIIEILPIRVSCSECGNESEAQANKLICKSCGNWRTTLVSGDEMLLMSLDLETFDQAEEKVLH